MNILDKIIAEKRLELAKLRPRASKLQQAAAARKDFRDFAGALVGRAAPSPLKRPVGAVGHRALPEQVGLIAEIKKASPSAGIIAPNFDPVRIAREYEAAGAAALSVLTDEKFFQGRIEYLQQIRDAVKLPLLRKDFIIDELQIYESVASGADAILLIVAVLDDAQLNGFQELSKRLKLVALVEVHDERELDRALAAGAEIIGVNNRDLKDFSVNLETTEKLAARLKRGISDKHTLVAESGIHTRADVERLAKAGVNAILVGESLMRSGDIAAKMKELMG